MRHKRTENGAATTELVVATPLLLLLLMLIVQFALWEHAIHVAQTAAERGVRVTRVDGGTLTDGQNIASAFLSENGDGIVIDPQVHATRDNNIARVEITGHSEPVVPGLHLPIKVASQGPVEVFR